MNIPRAGERCKHRITLEHCATCRPKAPRLEPGPAAPAPVPPEPAPPQQVAVPASIGANGKLLLTTAERGAIMREVWVHRRARNATLARASRAPRTVEDPSAHLRDVPAQDFPGLAAGLVALSEAAPGAAVHLPAAESIRLPAPPSLLGSEADFFAESKATKEAYDRAAAPIMERIAAAEAELAALRERFLARARLLAEEYLRLPAEPSP